MLRRKLGQSFVSCFFVMHYFLSDLDEWSNSSLHSKAPGKLNRIEFSRKNTDGWHSWHFCTSLNRNKLETIAKWINFSPNWHLSWCFELKLKSLISLIFNLIQKCQLCQRCVLRENSNRVICTVMIRCQMCFYRLVIANGISHLRSLPFLSISHGNLIERKIFVRDVFTAKWFYDPTALQLIGLSNVTRICQHRTGSHVEIIFSIRK